jgi:hypothetical protein
MSRCGQDLHARNFRSVGALTASLCVFFLQAYFYELARSLLCLGHERDCITFDFGL